MFEKVNEIPPGTKLVLRELVNDDTEHLEAKIIETIKQGMTAEELNKIFGIAIDIKVVIHKIV